MTGSRSVILKLSAAEIFFSELLVKTITNLHFLEIFGQRVHFCVLFGNAISFPPINGTPIS